MHKRSAQTHEMLGCEGTGDEWDAKVKTESRKTSWFWNLAQDRCFYPGRLRQEEEVENSVAEENREIRNAILKTLDMK